MAKLGCFNCPEIGHDNTRKLDGICPTCGQKYGFPLDFFPEFIDSYKVIKPLSRGFYGATYVVKNELLDTEFVIKIIPKSIYELHNKDFQQECRDHAQLARGSQHIVGITAMGSDLIKFSNGQKVDCHYQVLDYISGQVLKEVLEGEEQLSATNVAQIAIDLFRILDVLRQKKKNHNDLHPENLLIEKLPVQNRRADEIDNQIRIVAIDIGSLTSINKAGDSPDRQGDVHWVANYLVILSEKLLKRPDEVSDQDFRLASLLEDRARLLFPAAEFVRSPNFDEVIDDIKSCYRQQTFPWEEPLRLLNFNDTYNAQTLDPWYVPSLLVDPNDQWLSKISGKGPLVITGMRGCGKTMMLRALQFHARAASTKASLPNVTDQLKSFKNEGYVGIYVSCNKLLGEAGPAPENKIQNPFSKLFIRYGIEVIKALRHLKSISYDSVKSDFYTDLTTIYKEHLSTVDLLDGIYSEQQLEQRLLSMLYSLNRGEDKYIVKVNPANSFPALAQAIRKCSNIWANTHILYLLDDVSTRYLNEENIKSLLSSLIFQSEDCAFKITSEIQSIKFGLFSPGIVERAKKGRDFETFDLGGAVNDKIRNKGGKQFVIDILNRRAEGNIKHPKKNPIDLIGDVSLKEIAEKIVSLKNSKTLRQQIYHGLSALKGVCVGDIGDIINLYDLIIRHYDFDKKTTPIPSNLQNECFLQLCSIRLHEVNTRGSDKKDFALAFAEASHELLIRSSKNGDSKLRQYYSVYVRITTGDQEWQYNKVRELLDAGIFVYSGGANAPRSLGNDSNPIRQFKLNYRKLYGVSSLIGLTQGDRFELTGEQVEKWLRNPSDGKQILMENLGGSSSNVDEGEDFDEELIEIREKEKILVKPKQDSQVSLDFGENIEDNHYENDKIKQLINSKSPKASEIDFLELKKVQFDAIICGLGFEERALESFKSLLKLNTSKFLFVQYDEKGKGDEIIDLVQKSGVDFEIVPYDKVKTSFTSYNGNILCDVSGMSKAIIFNTIRDTLKKNKKVWVVHTYAKKYYPLNKEIKKALNNLTQENDNANKLDLVTSQVMKGESGPYEVFDLLFSDSDDSKRNVLIGFSSSKYERLFKILSFRSFDKLQIVTPKRDTMRGKLATIASEVIFKSNSSTELHEYSSDDLNGALLYLTKIYQQLYIDQNFNFEIALTGSKRNTIAAAAISAAFKISHCWYVKPAKWDMDSFSTGFGQKTYFKIEL
ncbi:ORC-CDC6 family AAA ATPase [Leeuwenhoekiella sp. H156]|uniref:ORC-CDC6 family AAA ATPase n=1 Tax=Leeuwenhoekiella sp. H156 TaxID=3450128 RepID=UPI003FA484FD